MAEGLVHIGIGTHALIEEDVEWKNLGLAIVDEQHRFGVMQRLRLVSKAKHPDVLVMTATPIPRTLALTIYGDLDVSVIDEMPPGRRPIQTKHVTDDRVESVYSFLKQQIAKGRQAYVVYPVIEESEAMKAAQQMYQHLSQKVFPDIRVGLLHGRLKTDEKETVMEQFRRGEVKILVSTTVIEVGVDVPNATVMVIEQAERFGLAQLHQLRGRVGRGAEQSYCILVTGKLGDAARERIRTMVDSTRWLLYRRNGSEAARPRRIFRHQAIGTSGAAHRQHHSRSGCARNGAKRGAGVHRESAIARRAAPRGDLYPRALAAPLRPGAGRCSAMRVIAGEFRSRRLKSLPGLNTRPDAGPPARNTVQRACAAHRRLRFHGCLRRHRRGRH